MTDPLDAAVRAYMPYIRMTRLIIMRFGHGVVDGVQAPGKLRALEAAALGERDFHRALMLLCDIWEIPTARVALEAGIGQAELAESLVRRSPMQPEDWGKLVEACEKIIARKLEKKGKSG